MLATLKRKIKIETEHHTQVETHVLQTTPTRKRQSTAHLIGKYTRGNILSSMGYCCTRSGCGFSTALR